MKNSFSSSVSKILLALVGVLTAFTLAFSATTGVAFAAAGTPQPTRTPRPIRTPQPTRTNDYSGLTKEFQDEQSDLSKQQSNLANAGNEVGKLQTLISQAQAKGLDTSALQSALSTFQGQLATAQSSDSNAASILSAHNGFDGSGNVTDPAAAKQTVDSARQTLDDAHTTLTQATHDLAAAVKAWEEANQDQRQNADLTKDYQNLQKWLSTQQGNLSKANDAVTKIQNLISTAQGKGIDTSALQSALTTYQGQLATAQSSDSNAASILSAHNGFDGSGNVTDPAAAKLTNDTARQALQDAETTLDQATHDLWTAVQTWEQQAKTQEQDADLTKDYQNLQKWLSTQQGNLSKANDAVTKVQNLITEAQGKGIDTTALQSALTIFQGQLTTAQSSDSNAAGILSAHNGFDGSGNVTDPTAAKQTDDTARQALQGAETTLDQATHDLWTAVQTWEQQAKAQEQDTDLAKAYQSLQSWLSTQDTNLTNANNVVAKVQELISDGQTKGLDTSALQTALTAYQGLLATAQSANSQAASILSAHNGFDGSGNVTDATTAEQTVDGARQDLQQAHDALSQACQGLQQAIQTWRSQNQPQPTATPSSSSSNGS
jgi:predicted  nucleic acid-binding Zn-ribbon protein